MGARAAGTGAGPALGLAALLFATALPRGLPSVIACSVPKGQPDSAGHTHSVTCARVGTPRVEGPARLLFGLPIDVNHADRLTLEALPGFGPKRAAAVLAARPFHQLEELEHLPGVGPVTSIRLAPGLTLIDGPGDTGERAPDGDLLPRDRR